VIYSDNEIKRLKERMRGSKKQTRNSKNETYLSKPSYDQICSSLAHLYQLTGKEMDEDMA
jgi:hypothetical protein